MRNVLMLTLLVCPHFIKAEVCKRDTIVVNKIWDKEKHNGFPDLYYFNNTFYCTFREAPGHIDNTNSGRLRIIKSKDAKNWETMALFEMKGVDVREARLSTMPDGRMLAIVAAGKWTPTGYETLVPYVSFSDREGSQFSPLQEAVIDSSIVRSRDWIWRVTWHKGIGYGVMYQVVGGQKSTDWQAYLLRTTNGKDYEKICRLEVDGNPNECTVRFDKEDKMYILVRREAEDKMGVLAKSEYPYNNWSFTKLDYRLGGPNFLFLDNKHLCIGSRLHDQTNHYTAKKNQTALFVTDLSGKVLKTIALPSGGDTGYPGMVRMKKVLWVAYYSSHEGKAGIYLARVPLKKLKLQ